MIQELERLLAGFIEHEIEPLPPVAFPQLLQSGDVLVYGGLAIVEGIDGVTYYDTDTKERFRLPQLVHPELWDVGGKCLFLGFDNQTFYDLITGKEAVKLPQGVYHSTEEVPTTEKMLVQGFDDCTFYDLETGQEAIRFPQRVRRFDGNVANHNFVQGLDGQTIYNIQNGEVVYRFSHPVSNCLFGGKGMLLVRGYDHSSFFEIETGTKVFTLPQRVFDDQYIVGEKFLVGGQDQQTFFDMRTGKEVYKLPLTVGNPITCDGTTIFFRALESPTFFDVNSGQKAFTTSVELLWDTISSESGLFALAYDFRRCFNLLDQGREVFPFPQQVYWEASHVAGKTIVLGRDACFFYEVSSKKEVFKLSSPVEATVSEVGDILYFLQEDNRTLLRLRIGKKVVMPLHTLQEKLGKQ